MQEFNFLSPVVTYTIAKPFRLHSFSYVEITEPLIRYLTGPTLLFKYDFVYNRNDEGFIGKAFTATVHGHTGMQQVCYFTYFF